MVRAQVSSKSKCIDQWSVHALLHQCLGWVTGAPMRVLPDRIEWLCVQQRGRQHLIHLSIDSHDLCRAEFALKKLGREKPGKLKKFLRNPNDWLARVDRLIAFVKQLRQSKAPDTIDLSDLFGQRWHRQYSTLCRTYPALLPLFQSVAFIQLTSTRPPDSTLLSWIQDNASFLEQIRFDDAAKELETRISLCLISPDVSPAWMSFLMKYLVESSEDRTDLDGLCASTEKLARSLAKESKTHQKDEAKSAATNTLDKTLVKHIDWLFQQKARQRRDSSRVLASLVDDAVFVNIRNAALANLSKATSLRREMDTCKRMGAVAYVIYKNQCGEPVEEIIDEDVGYESLRSDLAMLEELVSTTQTLSENKQWARDVSRFFETTKGLNWSHRVNLLTRWESRCDSLVEDPKEDRDYQLPMRRLTPLLSRRGVADNLLKHWSGFASGKVAWYNELICSTGRRCYLVRWQQTNRLIERLFYDGAARLSGQLISVIYAYARYAPSVDVAFESIIQTAALDQTIHATTSDIRAAFAISVAPDTVARLIVAMGDAEISEPAIEIVRRTNNRAVLDLVGELVLRGKKRPLAQLQRLFETLNAMDLDIPAIQAQDADEDWISHYPDGLISVLRKLATRCPNAEQIANQILQRDFPNPDRIQELITKVDGKLATETLPESTRENLVRQKDSLIRRLTTPKNVGDGRLKNLAAKIESRTQLETLNQFTRLCHESITEAFREFDPSAVVSERLLKRPFDHLIPAVFQLSGRERKIAIGLLLRADDESKNQSPLARENQRFVDDMTKRGINLKPWLSQGEPTVVRNANGDTFELVLETDTLELLLMGFHFDTCLSPTSFNFFSAVANTIDANKQVLFCRDSKGVVVGRCLLALTSEGKIQTFKRYLHDAELDFDNVVDQFAVELAKSMGTSLTSHGNVKPLVAKNWYDDGPIKGGLDLIRYCGKESKIAGVLTNAKLEYLVSDLEKIIGSRGTIRENLGSILDEDILRDRHEILEPLAAEFGYDPQVSFVDKLRLANLAYLNEKKTVAIRIVRSLNPKKLPKRLKSRVCRICPDIHAIGTESELLQLLVAADTQLAKRYITITRDHGVRSDAQETRKPRREVLATIHRKLGRYKLAEALTHPNTSNVEGES